jgi:hypothetical protein
MHEEHFDFNPNWTERRPRHLRGRLSEFFAWRRSPAADRQPVFLDCLDFLRRKIPFFRQTPRQVRDPRTTSARPCPPALPDPREALRGTLAPSRWSESLGGESPSLEGRDQEHAGRCSQAELKRAFHIVSARCSLNHRKRAQKSSCLGTRQVHCHGVRLTRGTHYGYLDGCARTR